MTSVVKVKHKRKRKTSKPVSRRRDISEFFADDEAEGYAPLKSDQLNRKTCGECSYGRKVYNQPNGENVVCLPTGRLIINGDTYAACTDWKHWYWNPEYLGLDIGRYVKEPKK